MFYLMAKMYLTTLGGEKGRGELVDQVFLLKLIIDIYLNFHLIIILQHLFQTILIQHIYIIELDIIKVF